MTWPNSRHLQVVFHANPQHGHAPANTPMLVSTPRVRLVLSPIASSSVSITPVTSQHVISDRPANGTSWLAHNALGTHADPRGISPVKHTPCNDQTHRVCYQLALVFLFTPYNDQATGNFLSHASLAPRLLSHADHARCQQSTFTHTPTCCLTSFNTPTQLPCKLPC